MVDINGDGIDDVTGLANGVVANPNSPSGYSYNGMSVTANGAPYRVGASGTSGSVVRGSQIPLDAEQIRASQANTAMRAQEIANQAAANTDRHNEAMANYALQGALAERQYQIDLQKF